jgi:hypothetical protein
VKKKKAVAGRIQESEWDVTLDIASVNGIGIEFVVEQDCLFICEVKGGAAENWNIENPHKAMTPGQRVVKIDGVQGIAEMLGELRKPHDSSLHIAISVETRMLSDVVPETTPAVSRHLSQKGFQLMMDTPGVKVAASPDHWGIKLNEIQAFWEWCKKQPDFHPRMNVRELVAEIINPLRKSVALKDKVAPTRIRWLVSHCWEEDSTEFFEDLFDMFDMLGPKVHPDDGIFVCFLCVFQGSDEEIHDQVTQCSEDIYKGCFAQILKSVKHRDGALCVIPNENLVKAKKGLYSRLWCGWEAYQAKEQSVKIFLHKKRCSPEHLFGQRNIQAYTLKSGSCGNPTAQSKTDHDNEQQIRHAIGGNWAAVDGRVRIAMLSAWSGDAADLVPFLDDPQEGVFEAVLLAPALQKLSSPCLAEVVKSLAANVHRNPERVIEMLGKMSKNDAAALALHNIMNNHDDATIATLAGKEIQRLAKAEIVKRKDSLGDDTPSL